MSAQNLAIVFGPTLFNGMLSAMADTSLQNRVRGTPPPRVARVCALPLTRRAPPFFASQAVETILEHYTDIFVDEGEES